jgi:putative Holliday junction resolvase
MPRGGRILAIDPGERRVGLAISDELSITAQGLDTFDARGGKDFFDHVSTLLSRYGVTEIVVGDPLSLRGEAGESAHKARALASELQRRFKVTVTLWDERFSSEEAKRALKGRRAAKTTVDKIAAMIILQSYLDYRGGTRDENSRS